MKNFQGLLIWQNYKTMLTENKIQKIVNQIFDESISNEERISYRKILIKLCLKYKLNYTEILNNKGFTEELKEYKIYFEKSEKKIIHLIIYKVLQKNYDIWVSKEKVKKQFFSFTVPKSIYIEINELMDFILPVFRKELEILELSIIHKYKLYKETDPKENEKENDSDVDFDLIDRILKSMSNLPEKLLKLNS